MEVIQHKSDRRQHQALERSYSGVFLIQQDINKHQSWDQCATGPPKQVMNSISHWGNPAKYFNEYVYLWICKYSMYLNCKSLNKNTSR